jgi:hypothetical protein
MRLNAAAVGCPYELALPTDTIATFGRATFIQELLLLEALPW